MIVFNKPVRLEESKKYVIDAIDNSILSGDGYYTKKCNELLKDLTKTKKVLLTTSGTHALEMAAILLNIKEGDEVIMPSYTFTSTANAFIMYGAKVVFVDVRPDTMNIDENLILPAITNKTKAIVPVHYAGVSCEMDRIMQIAKENNLYVVEDAAQGVMSSYKGKALGTIGDIGCYSFHSSKNYTMGEGGALLINNPDFIERSEIIREKGTDRSKFLRGEIDKYSWVDIGSSYLPSEINAAYLLPQLEQIKKINNNRLASWGRYSELLSPLKMKGVIEIQIVPEQCTHNAHMFYIKCKDQGERNELMSFLKNKGVSSVFHYIPLHSSKAGIAHTQFNGEDVFTTKDSERLLRLPMYYGLEEKEISYICEKIVEFYS